MDRRRYLQVLGVGGALSIAGCADSDSADTDATVRGKTLTLATATTAHDSGLLDELNPEVERLFGAGVDAVVRGTGASLQVARDGDCDVVLVHARPLEDEFLRAGHGINRRSVMVNDFLVVGPPDDPAGIAGEAPLAAFEAIADAGAPFVSRGDRSGTHVRERRLWAEAGIDPRGKWYAETGQGMGKTLLVAANTGAYTLTDRGTFLNVADERLRAHVDYGIEDPPSLLRNEYAVIPVNPARHRTNYSLAMAYVGYLTGPGRSGIESFRIDGKRAFRPLGPGETPSFEQYVPRDWRRE
ncbi:substrate-binding domain-containing protein [Natronomonas marina]|jgi:tungstate transport system substrate-binding protein|uniref:substrate-binding domain-containing protein n=1 Tax=Natronomonas marina TaxID=2961939 RepID=UPI0020C9666C|nr:substrate-binding domain-containing protein [Natronomonas marina]